MKTRTRQDKKSGKIASPADSLSVFRHPPEDSVLSLAAAAFSRTIESGPDIADPEVLRPLVLESIANAGAPEGLRGGWFDDLIEAKVDRTRRQILVLQASPPLPDEPNPILAGYTVAKFFRAYRTGCSLNDALYATAVEVGPGVSVAAVDAALRWFVAKTKACDPHVREALILSLSILDQLDVGDDRVNLTMSGAEFDDLAGAIDVRRLGNGA